MLLTTIVFLPLAGALLVLLAGGRGDNPERAGAVRLVTLAVSLVTFAATLYLWWAFDPASADIVRRAARVLPGSASATTSA
jgi:NADH:ubiquinone oxidoreductase subunit 4 (subunit M)